MKTSAILAIALLAACARDIRARYPGRADLVAGPTTVMLAADVRSAFWP